jgi:nucleotide-binding universal stress UspA family protein
LEFINDLEKNIIINQMLTILAPTDFSDNSKAGLRFAIHWSARQTVKLVFIHIFHAKRTPLSTDEEFEKFIEGEEIKFNNKLNRFVFSLYRSLGIKPEKYTLVARQGISADISLMDYCREHNNINYIAISTRGAGRMNKIFGTNTGNLITRSEVPVIVIPKKYRKQTLRSLLYTTDFSNSDLELKEVLAFARPLKIRIKLFHLVFPQEVSPDEKTLEKSLRKKFRYTIDVIIRKVHIENSIRENIQEQIKRSKPSLIAMFTDQNRSLFQKLFYPSKAEQLSFTTSVPLLTFPKSTS